MNDIQSVLTYSFVSNGVHFVGGLLFKAGGSNMQHVTSLSFLLLAYSNYLSHANAHVPCGGPAASPAQLKRVAKRQVQKVRNFNLLFIS